MKPLLALLALSIPALASAADAPDEQFFYDAAESGAAELKDANLAVHKSQDRAVKQFAEHMIQEHTEANDKLRTLAVEGKVDLPSHPSIKQSAEHAKLNVLNGPTFDKQFVEGQIRAHRNAIELFQDEAANGTNPKARDFARDSLPMLQSHLKEARKLAAQVGANVS